MFQPLFSPYIDIKKTKASFGNKIENLSITRDKLFRVTYVDDNFFEKCSFPFMINLSIVSV